MKLASENGMKVLLDGQGGDETLAGYLGYMAFYYANLLKRGRFLKLSSDLKAYKKLHGASYPAGEIIYPLVPGFIKKRSKIKQAYYMDKEFHNKYGKSDRYLSIVSSRPLVERLKNSMNYQLVELLRFEDKSSMAFSIETRLPFMDYRMVQFLFSLPDEMKLRDGQTKYIFRKIIEGVVPDSISGRHDKIGFATPDELWLKNENIRGFVNKILLSEKAFSRGIITGEGVKKLLADFDGGDQNAAKNIWSLVILELWFREFIDVDLERSKELNKA
jgi:asparagine synthase (glutamine-hydrolysing)